MAQHEAQVVLPADSNQALGLGRFAVEFMWGPKGRRGEPDRGVLERTNLFHVDSVVCGVSAIALGANSPTVLRREAMGYPAPAPGFGTMGVGLGRATRGGATVFGSSVPVMPEKAVLANSAAVREWDSNGTNFGYSETRPEHRAGEFGHNDFYPVAMAAAQMAGLDGAAALRGMVLLDEIRGRLAEVFSLKTHKIDHVVHGAIASAATFGAMLGATEEEIESAIGMVVAHAIPFRAIRHGHQLSDSKGASAAISTEFAVLCMKRAMTGFVGPKDIFRNPEAIFCLFAGRGGGKGEGGVDARWMEDVRRGRRSPFDLVLSRAGGDFAVMGMHFKLGLYEHQSAGALQGLIDLLREHPRLLSRRGGEAGGNIATIVVTAYEPAFSIIGDPAKRDPRTRQSADHSMLYLVCTMLRKAIEASERDGGGEGTGTGADGAGASVADWTTLMLLPHDFTREAIQNPLTRGLMAKMSFVHGGPEYDRRYPDGIPASVRITDPDGAWHDSGLVMYPAGHARNTSAALRDILGRKFGFLGELAVREPADLVARIDRLEKRSAAEVAGLYGFEILDRGRFE